MPIIRKRLKSSDVYPDNIRYNEATDTVQSLVNGTWVDNPAVDPRLMTTIPPHITAHTTCDAAASVTAALKGQIDKILTAIDGAGTAATIAGLIIGLFEFGPFGIFIAIALFIAHAMLDAGTTALNAALTDTVYQTLTDILFCHMNADGRLNPGGLAATETDVTARIGGLGATILNAMLSLAGEGGVNNLAALGMTTGDCSSADCGWCVVWDFTVSDYGFTYTNGTYTPGVGIVGTVAGTGVAVNFAIPMSSPTILTWCCTQVNAGPGTCEIFVATLDVFVIVQNLSAKVTGHWGGDIGVVDVTGANRLVVNPSASSAEGGVSTLVSLEIRGRGANPFSTGSTCDGTDDCA
jgi:hypothetical protein